MSVKLLIVIKASLDKGTSEVCSHQQALGDVWGTDPVSLQTTNYTIVKFISVPCWKDQYSEPDVPSQEFNGIQALYSFLWELSSSLAKTVEGINVVLKAVTVHVEDQGKAPGGKGIFLFNQQGSISLKLSNQSLQLQIFPPNRSLQNASATLAPSLCVNCSLLPL